MSDLKQQIVVCCEVPPKELSCVMGPISYKTVDLEVALDNLAAKSTKNFFIQTGTGF